MEQQLAGAYALVILIGVALVLTALITWLR